MKVSVSLTIKQAAYVFNKLFTGYPVKPEYNELKEEIETSRVNTLLLGESFETQVLDQIIGTKYYDEYRSLRTNGKMFMIDGLPWFTRAVFPYSPKYNGREAKR